MSFDFSEQEREECCAIVEGCREECHVIVLSTRWRQRERGVSCKIVGIKVECHVIVLSKREIGVSCDCYEQEREGCLARAVSCKLKS